MFQIQKRSAKTFEWIYDPAITDHRFCNIGTEAQPMTTIKITPEASHASMNLVRKCQKSQKKSGELNSKPVSSRVVAGVQKNSNSPHTHSECQTSEPNFSLKTA